MANKQTWYGSISFEYGAHHLTHRFRVHFDELFLEKLIQLYFLSRGIKEASGKFCRLCFEQDMRLILTDQPEKGQVYEREILIVCHGDEVEIKEGCLFMFVHFGPDFMKNFSNFLRFDDWRNGNGNAT